MKGILHFNCLWLCGLTVGQKEPKGQFYKIAKYYSIAEVYFLPLWQKGIIYKTAKLLGFFPFTYYKIATLLTFLSPRSTPSSPSTQKQQKQLYYKNLSSKAKIASIPNAAVLTYCIVALDAAGVTDVAPYAVAVYSV